MDHFCLGHCLARSYALKVGLVDLALSYGRDIGITKIVKNLIIALRRFVQQGFFYFSLDMLNVLKPSILHVIVKISHSQQPLDTITEAACVQFIRALYEDLLSGINSLRL